MGALTGIVAGVATVVGAIALMRYAERKTKEFRDSLNDTGGGSRSGEADAVIEFEKDPVSGDYRQKNEG